MEFRIPNSKWIWASDPGVLKSASANLVLFRKSFEIGEARQCRLRVSADARYKLYCNGGLIALGPAKGDRSVWYYDEVDLTPYLRPGKNVLCAQVLQYPTGHNLGSHSVFRTNTPGLYVEEIYEGLKEPVMQTTGETAADTEDTMAHGCIGLTADGSWRWHYVGGFSVVQEAMGFAPLMFMEKVEADPALLGWTRPDFDDSAWQHARPYSLFEMRSSVVPGNLLPRPIPQVYREDRQFEGVVQAIKSGSNVKA